jgi:histidyl-tRNA synthetase
VACGGGLSGRTAQQLPPHKHSYARAAARRFLVSAMADGSGGRASAAVVQDKDKAASKGSGGKSEKLDLQPPKGTRDFYPEDMRLRNWLFGHWKEVARVYGFDEYDAPVLENEALYIRKAGEEVTQQLYNFEDKGERRVALRPEMTPSLARMVMAKGKSLSLPVKWFSLPQCWRYERMTRGRRREHFQWNMDIWGVPGIEAEAELLSAITTFFTRVGISSADVGIKVNSRAVLAEVLSKLGVPEDKFAATCVLVDKLEKVDISAIKGDMEELGLTEEIINKLLETIAIKDLAVLESVLGDVRAHSTRQPSGSSSCNELQ